MPQKQYRTITKTVSVEEETCTDCGRWYERYARYEEALNDPNGFFTSSMPTSWITSPSECPECHDERERKRYEEYKRKVARV